jgi:hypothetical protein
MAKFSMKKGGKEVGSAEVYAEPHSMDGKAGVDIKNSGYEGGSRMKANDVNMSVGNISRNDFSAAKTDGVEIRGCGAATKGTKARGPMA